MKAHDEDKLEEAEIIAQVRVLTIDYLKFWHTIIKMS